MPFPLGSLGLRYRDGRWNCFYFAVAVMVMTGNIASFKMGKKMLLEKTPARPSASLCPRGIG
jgi:hypothetical protein